MTKSQLFSDVFDENQSSGVALKNKELKKIIFNFLDKVDTSSITELSKELNISVPKTTSLINELIKNELIKDEGKVESTGGRKANMYGLVPDACFFLGVDIKKYYININQRSKLITRWTFTINYFSFKCNFIFLGHYSSINFFIEKDPSIFVSSSALDFMHW